VWAKPDQHTTPVDAASAVDEFVTIVDPCHALFGQTLLLLEVANKPYRGRCCVVQLREGFCCHVPWSATSRSVEPPTIFPIPLDLTALGQLLTIYQRLTNPIGKVSPDGSPSRSHPARICQDLLCADVAAQPDCTGTGLATVEPDPTADSVCHSRASLPKPAPGRLSYARSSRGTKS
jgi:hypothetical protein